MTIEQFTERYLKPAIDDLWRRVRAGESITPDEAKLIRNLGRESQSWALNVKSDEKLE